MAFLDRRTATWGCANVQHFESNLGRNLSRLLFLTLAIVGVVLLADRPALAHDTPLPNCPYPWTSEDQMIHLPLTSPQSGKDCWRPVVWPGTGDLLDRRDLYRHASNYASLGYTRNFLWYAPRTTIRVANHRNRDWTGCNHLPVGEDRFCSSINQSALSKDFDLVNADPRLTVLAWSGDWIALACGNVPPRPDQAQPVPTITARKFHDLNGNGQRDPSEPYLSGWRFRLVQVSSLDPHTPVASPITRTTNSTGRVTFSLNGLSPGRYRVEELAQTGWVATTSTVRTIDVAEGIGSSALNVGLFGNTRRADPEKVSFELIDPPAEIEARTDTDLTVRSTIRNNGPGGPVTISETITVDGPDDCTIVAHPAMRELTLIAGETVVVDATVTVNCDLPSFHQFEFGNQVEIVSPGVIEGDPDNNTAGFAWEAPVVADADIAVDDVTLACPGETMVDEGFACTVAAVVLNNGPYGPVDAEATLNMSGPADCAITPRSGASRSLEAIEAGTGVEIDRTFDVTCSHRSFHDFSGAVSARATDIHVHDASHNNEDSIPATVEVFESADLEVTDVHLECDEQVGDTSFTCIADVDVVNRGPAEDVASIVYADLSLSEECSVQPARRQQSEDVLAVGAPVQHDFAWEVTCPAGEILHPFQVTVDVIVDLDLDPHIVDAPGPVSDVHAVPTCVETVNPHGQQIPQAPGQGQNEDGFYQIGFLPSSDILGVWVRDTETQTLFGPFAAGTNIKWVEANGAEPSISPMGGNNGNGNGQAAAVDFQIRAPGDMEVVVFDEDGGEVTALCLVPPPPK